jgi:hypothetical protein
MSNLLVGFYVVCLGVGFIYVLISLILGEIASHGGPSSPEHSGLDVGQADAGVAVDAGADVGDVGADAGSHVSGHTVAVGSQDLPWFSPIILASFLASFGGMGLVAKILLNLGDAGSLIFAMPIALGISIIIFLLVAKLLFGSAASSEAVLGDVIGSQAEVVTGIPENALGEIAYICKGFRYKSPARSYDGEPIEVGARVRMVRTDGYIMTVKKI